VELGKAGCVRRLRLLECRKGQMKIQQMAFMIMAVFFFFLLVGLFFLNVSFRDVKKSAMRLHREEAISSLEVIADMPELNYDSRASASLDEDKLMIMSGKFGRTYEGFWPVASVKVYKVYPRFDKVIKCPKLNCNYFEVYNSGQKNVREYSTYVSICKRVSEKGYVYDKCGIGKLVVGVLDVKK